MTDDVMSALRRSLHAEATGDVDEAIRHFRTSPLAASAPHMRYLQEVRDLGDDAPGWVWSRWILQQAHRWLFLNQDERLRDAGMIALATTYADIDQLLPRGREPGTFVVEVMAMDWLCRQLALYEFGGLADYVDAMVKPPLLKRADQIMAWSTAPMNGFRVEGVAGGAATLTDLADGARRQVLNIGWLAESTGMCVVGRLVPTRSEPGWIFDSRPREVSDEVAEAVSRGAGKKPVVWAQALGDAVLTGELDWPLDTLACLHPLSSDLLPYTWSAPADELAEAAYDVCVSSLEAAAFGEESAAKAAPYVGAVLVNRRVFDAARDRLIGAEHRAGWEALARNTHEPVRGRCRELAALCHVAA